MQRNGIRSFLATNPDSTSEVKTPQFRLCLTAAHLAHSWCDGMGVIAYNTRSPLVLIRGPLTAQRCVLDILPPHVLPLMQRLSRAIFQQDNAQPHTARVSQDFVHVVTTLPWPVRSPDFSSI
ncbi:transposable element Tcb2 transposase [Trichonephila clavipes]|nr:transposable element Tcb2 transposase [Trichonephila clavipes]